MGVLPAKWFKWIAVVLGAAGMLTPALIELGWIPEQQALKAVIFLLGFIVLGGATRESNESAQAPELFTTSEGYFHALNGFLPDTKHEILSVVRGHDIVTEEAARFVGKVCSTLRSEKQLHIYTVVASSIGDLSEESFRRRSAIERDPSLEGRFHYRFVDSPVTFGCQVFDQKHWTIDFPPNPAGPKGVAIVFKNHPEGARLVASFIRHEWLERSGAMMSLSEAYEKWKVAASAPEPEQLT
jgi:hypothetical protein